jgi:pimeloyl-ACP methyl ester carboxylesterase
VRGVLALAPPLYHDPEDARARMAHAGTMARLAGLDNRWVFRRCQWMCDHRRVAIGIAPLLRPDLPAPIARDGMRHTWASYSQTVRRVILAADTRGRLEDLAVPARLVFGSRDRVAPAELGDRLASGSVIGTEVWDGGHDLPLEAPERCVAAIDDCLHAWASRPGEGGGPHGRQR